jgi:hypothetical protein
MACKFAVPRRSGVPRHTLVLMKVRCRDNPAEAKVFKRTRFNGNERARCASQALAVAD